MKKNIFIGFEIKTGKKTNEGEKMRKQKLTDKILLCKCGCGQNLREYNKWGDKVEYIFGHSKKGKSKYDKTLMISCACGCGELRHKFDKRGREKRFINGHQTMKGEKNLNYKKEIHTKETILCACGCGELRLRFDEDGQERFYLVGHKNRFKQGQHPSSETQFKQGHKLEKKSEMKRRKNISLGRKGMKFDEKHCMNISKGKKGVPNPKVSLFMKKQIGSKSHHWMGGLSFEPYSLEFNKAFKEAIRIRDGFLCLKCGMRQEDSKILLKRILTVHHVDYDKENTIPENCCALCNRCNIEVNNNRLHWTKFFQSLLAERYGYKYSEDGKIILELKNG